MLLNKKDYVKFFKIKEDLYYPKVKQPPKMNDFYDPIYSKMFARIDLGFIVNDVLNNIVFDPHKSKQFDWKLSKEFWDIFQSKRINFLEIILSQKKEISKSSEKN